VIVEEGLGAAQHHGNCQRVIHHQTIHGDSPFNFTADNVHSGESINRTCMSENAKIRKTIMVDASGRIVLRGASRNNASFLAWRVLMAV
jgi:hypothetical protein